MPISNITINNKDRGMHIADSAADPNSGGHVAARDGTTATDLNAENATTGTAGYVRTSKGGNTVYQVLRYFGFYDTSSITDSVLTATLNFKTNLYNSANVIAVKSTAFGGDGSSSADANSFNDLDFSTPYSSATTMNSHGNFSEISLNATAIADIENNNIFIFALCQYENDFQDSDPGVGVVVNDLFRCDTGDDTNASDRPFLSLNIDDGSRPIILKTGLIKLKTGLIKIK
tara:strand:- start:1458 stop:2150 length:693 start_codon:yes stop_codon:yes gene_type:complete